MDVPIDGDLLAAMADRVAHRGPDDAGYYVGAGIGLAHRRLSIVDVEGGHQPLANEDGTVWVVFNGEIYNFVELRRELTSRGHRFQTRSDTEVIVHGYEEWGAECVTRLRGMFAFGLWDARQRRLVLARDRVGIKPLYYSVPADGGVVFGSEIKSILADPAVRRGWSAEALDAYLTLLYVPGPATIYRDIHKVPPGHVLVAEDGHVRISRYWDLHFTGDGDGARTQDYLEQLDVLLRESVAIRLRADVGAFLSGGIDSTAIVAYMVETSRSPVLATAVGFNEQPFNEIDSARAVADHLRCGLTTSIVTPDVGDLLPRLAWHFDEPFADSSAIPTYCVSAVARERGPVALSGDGGDELWAGYAKHRVEQWEGRARASLGAAGCRIAGALGHVLPLSIKGARSLRRLGSTPAAACADKHAYGHFEGAARRGLYSADFQAQVRGADPFASFRDAYAACSSQDPVDRALYVDVKTYLVDDILTKVDRMSMAASLETRVPLLDHRLIEFAATVPTSLKLRGGSSKYLLRELLARRVPRAILDRPKRGFAAPIGEWLRGPLAGITQELLFDGRLDDRGIFHPPSVARLWNDHHRQRRDHRHRLWSLVMLELWFRQFVDSAPRPTRAAGRGVHAPAR